MLQKLVQGRDVRKADQRLGCERRGRGHRQARREGCEQPHGPVPAAGAEHRLACRIRERGDQLREPAGVVPREVAMPRENVLVVADTVTLADDRQARLE